MSATLALIEDDLEHRERVVALRGELDVASEGGTRSLAVDLGHVTFLAVSGVHVLVDEQHRMAAHRARLTIVCPHPRLLGLFELCRLDDALSIVASRAELSGSVWTLGDDLRALRLERWLDRYERSRPA